MSQKDVVLLIWRDMECISDCCERDGVVGNGGVREKHRHHLRLIHRRLDRELPSFLPEWRCPVVAEECMVIRYCFRVDRVPDITIPREYIVCPSLCETLSSSLSYFPFLLPKLRLKCRFHPPSRVALGALGLPPPSHPHQNRPETLPSLSASAPHPLKQEGTNDGDAICSRQICSRQILAVPTRSPSSSYDPVRYNRATIYPC